MAHEALGWLSGGMQGMKVGFCKRGNANLGFEHDRDIAYVRKMRQTIGPERKLMIDLGVAVRWDVATAVRRIQAFDEFDVDWVEEPLGAWDPEGYATLRAKTRTLIAYGEREWTAEGYERIMSTGTCGVAGIDPGRAEGITGFRLAADMLHAHQRTGRTAIPACGRLGAPTVEPARPGYRGDRGCRRPVSPSPGSLVAKSRPVIGGRVALDSGRRDVGVTARARRLPGQLHA